MTDEWDSFLSGKPSAYKQPNKKPYEHKKVDRASTQEILDSLAMGSSVIPGVGDAMGIVADANMYKNDPKSRTAGNFALSALGLLPFVPGAAGVVNRINIKPLNNYFGQGTVTDGLDDMTGTKPNTKSLDVLKNPTEDELKRFAGRDIESFRTFVDNKGDVYAWNAEDAIHDQVLDGLGINRKSVVNEMSDTNLPAELIYPRLKEWSPEANIFKKGTAE